MCRRVCRPLSAPARLGWFVFNQYGKSYAYVITAVGLVSHWLKAAVQNSPVPDQQSTEPHLQTPAFSEAPLLSEHAAAWLQVLEEDAQMSPVADVHKPKSPQTQGAGLAVVPLVWAQAGPVKAHRQASESL